MYGHLRNRVQTWSAIDERVDEGRPSLVTEDYDRCDDQHHARCHRTNYYAPVARDQKRERKQNADLRLEGYQPEKYSRYLRPSLHRGKRQSHQSCEEKSIMSEKEIEKHREW